MCGIAGIVSAGEPASQLRSSALAMANTLAHRGPDGDGIWVDADTGVALAHRRLAIVDLSPAGAQPMTSPSGRYVMVYNGEIFNFRELGAELAALGDRFVGHSDTEVILHVMERWGVRDALQRLNGQFAFAVWDRERRELTLARDRFGEKPLYYTTGGAPLLFGSELKALAGHPGFRSDIDRGALADLLRYSCVRAPRTIYSHVRKLPPGTFCVFAVGEGGTIAAGEPQAYWRVADVFARARARPYRGSFEDAVVELDSRLKSVVGARMVSDVPLGAFLSGGVDSSAVVALMQAQSSTPVRTFTIGFAEGGFDESVHAAAVASHLGTRHTRFEVTPGDALAVVPSLAQIYDEPFADSSQIPSHLVARLARREVTVALTGDGGDEVFSGYNRYFWWRNAWGRFRHLPAGVRRAMGGAITAIPAAQLDRMFRMAGPLLPSSLRFGNPGERLHKLAPMIGAASAGALYEMMIAQTRDPQSLLLDPLPVEPAPPAIPYDAESIVDYMVERDLTGYLPDDVLAKVDRATMAASLESRAPYLDADLLEFSLSLPLSYRVSGTQGKIILKRLLDRYVPRALMDRTKAGFAIPLGAWLRGPLREWAEELLAPESIRSQGFFNQPAVTRLWTEHQSGRQERQHLLWSILMFQAWRSARGTPAPSYGVS
ncbi:MAG TPA: asparagine synthase (glutamine-hydrolyzing) [Steroidobacteraceae bacterium]|nr:asparagine synthase (glutamine-hydrolyzing) [Steroidobacteraceae bacterium]